jgi:uncharacterized damage-inducible protein DinB/predicted RNase H-like HicB family nuclease
MGPYKLYVESGPRRKKTMVHVLDLLGCIANGPTTEQALARTPAAIDNYRRFLTHHGETVDVESELTTEIAIHITEGIWLGNGDPSLLFEPDMLPLTEEDGEAFIQRLEWMWAEIVALIDGLTEAQLDEKPKIKGRAIRSILEHILESEYAYMYAFGRPEGLPALGSIVKKQEGPLLEWMATVQLVEYERLRSLTWEERSEPFIHWKYTRTARKVMRRMLEHRWEHLMELQERLTESS